VAEHSLITLLLVDNATSDNGSILQTLRDKGYEVEELRSTDKKEIQNFIEYKPINLIMLRQGKGVPTITQIRKRVERADKIIPIIALIDGEGTQIPIALLAEGADNFVLVNDPAHLALVVGKELDQARAHQQAQSLDIRFQETDARCKELLENSRDAIAYIHEGAHIYANPAYLKHFGYASADDILGVALLELVDPEDHDQFKSFLRRNTRAGKSVEPVEIQAVDKNGERFPARVECLPTRMNEEPCLQIVFHPIIERSLRAQDYQQVLDERLKEFSKYEPVTGLYNRKFFTEYLEGARAQGGGGAVIYILLSAYRTISEQLGLEAVDHLAGELAELLKDLISEQDVLARFSDAVFTIYTAESARKNLLQLGNRICAAIKGHTSHAAGRLITTGSCVGISVLRSSHESANEILIYADRACESARQQGGNQAQVYSPPAAFSGSAAEEGQLLIQLRDAISEQRMELLFQPIANFQGEVIERYKVYLQIFDEEHTPLPMDKLQPLAESRNLMRPLDKWMISRCMEILAQRYQQGREQTVLFINVSANSLVDDGFCPWLGQCFKDTGLSGSVLVLEVSEETAEQYYKQMQVFKQRLQALQCGLAISHFGGKPHSEKLLQSLEPNYIKLDGALIEQVAKGKDEESREAVARLTAQAQEKHTQIVAARVSNATQMAGIWQFGVTLIQGDMVQEASTQMEFDFQQFAG
jgi:diguanylate cyclase (GGDEF)-like protein/PAS domain S-box-containing protein